MRFFIKIQILVIEPIFFFLQFLVDIFYPLDPDPESQNLADPDPNHCLQENIP